MNTKKIWMISLILGLMVAGVVYISIFAKDNTTAPASGSVSQDQDDTKDGVKSEEEIEKEKQAEKEKALLREFANPIVDVSPGEEGNFN